MPLIIRELVLTIRSEAPAPRGEESLDPFGDRVFGDGERRAEEERDAAVREAVAEQLRIERNRKER